jgi:hypothetical protein
MPTKEEAVQAALAATMAETILAEMSDADAKAFLRLMTATTLEAAGVKEEALFQEYVKALTGPVSEVATAKARDLASKEATRQITLLSESAIKQVGEVIATGLEEGKGPLAIARNLDAVKGLDRNRAATYRNFVNALEESGFSDADVEAKAERMFQKLLRDRKRTIAKTEGADAVSTAREFEAQERGARFKVWITVGDERVRESHLANEAQGAIPIDEPFQSGEMRPGEEPNDRCSIAYYTNKTIADEAGERGKERAAATLKLQEEAQAAKEAA